MRSGWESVTVSGVDATIADDGTKALKKVTYSAVEGTKVTFSNGTKSYNVTPTNGNVYYVESSSLKGGYAYADYSWAPPTPTTDYTIYFDALRSGWANLEVTAGEADVTISTEGKLKKITFTAGESVNVTFKNGTKTLTATPVVNGNVYYVNADGTLNGSTAAASYTPETYSYRLHGDIFTGSWATQDVMKANTDGTYSFTANITKQGNFGIKRLTPDEQVGDSNTWIYTADGTEISTTDTEYNAAIKIGKTGSDFKTTLPNGEYTIIFNPTTMKVKFVAGAVTPTTYRYRFHSNMVSGTWPADDNNDPAWAMTEQSDGTWMWQGSLTASGAFGFKRLGEDEAPSKNNQWIYCSSKSANAITRGEWSGAKLKANNTDTSGADWTFTPDGGTYQVIFDPANMRTKIVKVGTTVDYSRRTYVISGTFNGWIAPADNKDDCAFEYQETGENAGKYVWSYEGLMKNVEFKICDLTKLEEDSDKKWGKAYGTTYNGSNRDKLTAGTPGTPGTAYNMRRTNVPGEDVLIETAELYNPTFVLDPATMTVTVTNNPVAQTYTYLFHSNFTNDDWSSETMTQHADGSWSYTCKIPNGKEFGIRQMNGETQNKWIASSEVTTGTKAVSIATSHAAKAGGQNWATDNATVFDNSTSYTIVFTPTSESDGTGTLVIYNNTAVDATIQPAMAENGTDYLIVDGQKANEIVVKVPVANYLGTDAGPFTLSMGDNAIATASKDAEGNVTFEYLPYLSGTREFTLKGADKAVKLNVNSPELAGSYFTLGKYKSLTLVANENGYIDVAVACEPTSTLVYDIPVWYYTIGDYTYEAEEVRSPEGISAAGVTLARRDGS